MKKKNVSSNCYLTQLNFQEFSIFLSKLSEPFRIKLVGKSLSQSQA